MATATRTAAPKQVDAVLKRDVLAGLRRPHKELPCKYFYDRRGADLFDKLSNTPEYYVTRTELMLLKTYARQLADLIGEGAHLVELGGCNTQKARILLGAMRNPLVYIPVDISTQHLWSSAMQLQLDYPYLAVRPINADFTKLTELPQDSLWVQDHVTFLFFGSTIGNFDPISASLLLKRLAGLTIRNMMVVGVDLRKDTAVLERAYNDSAGFTAEFNLNLLLRLNRELDGEFDISSFEHIAFYNAKIGRIEMYLRSRRRQTVRLAGETLAFEQGELIHTENSYKYSPGQFHAIARRAHFMPVKSWTDSEHLFSLQVLAKSGERLV